MSEHDEQVGLFQWARIEMSRGKYPELYHLFAIPNGGLRNIVVAKKLKAEGLQRGIPDVFLSVARQGYNGLFIEMKYGKNKPSKEQKERIGRLKEEGYRVEVSYTWGEAIEVIENYLTKPF